jgi:hypothetical protein
VSGTGAGFIFYHLFASGSEGLFHHLFKGLQLAIGKKHVHSSFPLIDLQLSTEFQ